MHARSILVDSNVLVKLTSSIKHSTRVAVSREFKPASFLAPGGLCNCYGLGGRVAALEDSEGGRSLSRLSIPFI